jgi:hypothetical protein
VLQVDRAKVGQLVGAAVQEQTIQLVLGQLSPINDRCARMDWLLLL